ncbi:MAG TPA: hypothetical protein VHD33_06005 [Legionellaceae bacterium]|nr:hypothetical protein [Legionellaceae bacterium]
MKLQILKYSLLTLFVTAKLSIAANVCDKIANEPIIKINKPEVLSRVAELDLNTPQKEKFIEIQRTYIKNQHSVNKEILNIKAQMNQLIIPDTLDEKQLSHLLFQLKQHWMASQTQTIMTRHQLYNILKEPQQDKYKHLQQEERAFIRLSIQCPEKVAQIRNQIDPDPLHHLNELNLLPKQQAKILLMAKAVQIKDRRAYMMFDDSVMSANEMDKKIVQSPKDIPIKQLQEYIEQQTNVLLDIQKRRIVAYHAIYHLLDDKQKNQFITLLKAQ